MLRFWKKVDVRGPDECWEWTGFRHPKGGYGVFWLGRSRQAHRVAWLLETGEDLSNDPPASDRRRWGREIDHTCRNRACVNPAHLRIKPFDWNREQGRLQFLANSRS